ncbi:MAG TPA: hypothetical protein VKU85_03455, partial [bacterium]|nr:hypothetical protein [bacterium]
MLFGIRARLAMALVVTVLVAGCAAGYRTTTTNGHEKVYHVDKEGQKNLVYEVEPDGTLVVHDETDPRARQMLAAQERQTQLQALEEERIAVLRDAPKRAPDDPIRVIVHPMEVEEKLAQAQHSEGAIDEQYREEFRGDALIRMVEPAAVQGNELTQAFRMLSGQEPTEAVSAGPAADVEVATRAYVKEKVGYNKTNKEFGTYAALIYEATITS